MTIGKSNAFQTGRGAQIHTANKFLKLSYIDEDTDGLDEPVDLSTKTSFYKETAKKAISQNNSPDIPFLYSVNPYQGCEHGCIYCYARNSHEYWGLNAGLDFEQKIIIKHNVTEILEKEINKKNYQPSTIMLSGNTDCYQPAERKLKLTRSVLSLMLEYKHPVSIITKNTLVLRDLDLLKQLAAMDLVHVSITINSLNEKLRLKLEPRTAASRKRLDVIQQLSQAHIPVSLMCAPIIPGLNHDEMPALIKEAADRGAQWASYTIVRLNGTVSELFKDWLEKTYPDRYKKVLNLIASCHNGQVNDSRWRDRMRGDGKIAEHIAQLFSISRKRYMGENIRKPLRTDLFTPKTGRQLILF